MTERIYYHDSYATEFNAQIVSSNPDRTRVYLNRTAFYPASGGQPFDLGQVGGVPVIEIIDEEERIAHVLAAPLEALEVSGQIHWNRRFDHMQQHTGQHLLSAVFADVAQAATVSFHMGAESSTLDLAVPSLDPDLIKAVEGRANQIVFENRPVAVEFQQSSDASGLRKASDRAGLLRIVSIRDLDRSACGGTHVRATGEIGPILIRKLEKLRGNIRVEFLCGMRSVRRARADYEALSRIARSFSAPMDEAPALVAAQIEKLAESDKARRKLRAELATAKGRALYAETQPDSDGTRRILRRLDAITDDLRTEAQSFASGSKAVMLLLASDPPSVLLATSNDSGVDAGRWLKTALSAAGGRGGGSPTMAQGSVPSEEALNQITL